MNILVIPSWFSTKENRIKGSFFLEQAQMVYHNGANKVSLIYVQLHKPGAKIESVFDIYEDNGITVFIKNIHSFGFAKFHVLLVFVLLINYLQLFRKYRKKKNEKPNIIQAHAFLPAGIVSCIIGQIYNVPVVITEHSSSVHTRSLSKTELRSLKYVVKNAKYTCAVSKSLANVIKEYTGNENVKVIPNNLSPIFKFSADKKTDKQFVFYTAGNMIESKRIGLLVRCFNKAFQGDTNFILKIAGDGVLKREIEQYVDDHNLNNVVIFLGRIGREDIAKLAAESNAFALLSTHETFGVVYIEAIASGCPVIATRNGGAEDIVTEDNGLLVDIDDKEQIIDALQYMYKNYRTFDLPEISSDCISKYGEAALYDLTMGIYNSVCQKRNLL